MDRVIGGGGRGGIGRKSGLMSDGRQLDLDFGVGGVGSDAALTESLRQMTTAGELTTAFVTLHEDEEAGFWEGGGGDA